MPDSVARIYNYRQVSAELATSGQPKEDQLAAISEAGYEVVINLGLHDDPRYSLPDETKTVNALRMEYVHIPVKFDAPTRADLLAFFDAMARNQDRKVWVHCGANMRVTAFVGLYRVLRQSWQAGPAFELMDSVWKPDKVWASFIKERMEDRDG
jgi:protein tyrosine phosphatase (PTP) superfamily phosphohydrolase (DUF442 family)